MEAKQLTIGRYQFVSQVEKEQKGSEAELFELFQLASGQIPFTMSYETGSGRNLADVSRIMKNRACGHTEGLKATAGCCERPVE